MVVVVRAAAVVDELAGVATAMVLGQAVVVVVPVEEEDEDDERGREGGLGRGHHTWRGGGDALLCVGHSA